MLSYFVVNSLGNNIGNSFALLKRALKNISDGNLKEVIDIKTGDEFENLGEELNRSINKIHSLISNISENAEVLLKSSENISMMDEGTTALSLDVAKAIESISKGAISQSTNVNESVSSMEALSAQLNDIMFISENMCNSSEISNKLIEKEGQSVINSLLDKYEKSRSRICSCS